MRDASQIAINLAVGNMVEKTILIDYHFALSGHTDSMVLMYSGTVLVIPT